MALIYPPRYFTVSKHLAKAAQEILKVQKRYFFSRRPNGPGGVFKILDRELDSRIATCDYRENAQLIVDALNALHEIEGTAKEASHE